MPPNNQQPIQQPTGLAAANDQQPVTLQWPTSAPVEPRSHDPSGPNHSNAPKATVNPNTTQNSLLISEIREGMVIMSDGSFRAVIACKSINFDLMSSREREGVEFSYQNFLNATLLSYSNLYPFTAS